MKKIFLSLLLTISFLFLSGLTTLAESDTIDGETYFNDYFNYEWDFYKFNLTDMDIILVDTYTTHYYLRINVKLPDNALIDGVNTPLAIYSFNGYKLKYGNIVQNAQYYNIYSITPGDEVRVNITINKGSIDDYLEANNLDPANSYDFYSGVAEYINQYFVAYYAKTDTYEAGYEDGYEDGYNDFNVADYFGDRNIAKAPDIDYGTASDPFEPSTAIVLINKGYGAPNILLDKPYLLMFIKKGIYDDIIVLFDDYSEVNQRNATRHDMGDYDIYVFNFTNKINSKYRLEIRKENITTSEQLNKFLNDVKENLYFSHASKLLDSDMAVGFYEMGYVTGLEQSLSNHEAYEAGYEKGYDDGYYDGKDDGYYIGYEDGFDDGKTAEYDKGYKDGYKQGSYNTFLNDVAKWFGPMVLIVLIAGAYVTARNRRSDD